MDRPFIHNKYNKPLGKVLIIVGLSRVYVGHHFPLDIVGTYAMVLVISYIYNAKLSDKVSKIYDKIESMIANKLGFTWLYE